MKLFIELHDHTGLVHDRLRYEYNNEDTWEKIEREIYSRWEIEDENQQIFFDNGKEYTYANSEDSLKSLGLQDRNIVIVKHRFLPKWTSYLSRMDMFRETRGNDLKKEAAVIAHREAKELDKAKFFSAYASFTPNFVLMRKECATFLDNTPDYIKEAVSSYFRRKFKNELIEVEFRDKPSGTRPGAVCVVSSAKARRVFYVKTNHNASSIHRAHCNPLNVIELYIYKLLEVLGVGAVIEFIPNVVDSDKIVFICGEEVSAFKTLVMLEREWDAFERKIVKKREDVAKAIIHLSLLAQILGLKDLHAENVGFIEIDFSLIVVDFWLEFIDSSVAFEVINRPKNILSLVHDLKRNLGRFSELVEEMTFEEQLEIGKQWIVQSEINSKLDVAFAELEKEKNVFNRAGLGTEIVKDYITVVREKISQINNL